MNAPLEDDFELRVRCADHLRGGVTISYALQNRRSAGIRISYEGQCALQFVSKVIWPHGDNYEAAVRKGILIALDERGRHSLGEKFILTDATVDPVESCEAVFTLVAK